MTPLAALRHAPPAVRAEHVDAATLRQLERAGMLAELDPDTLAGRVAQAPVERAVEAVEFVPTGVLDRLVTIDRRVTVRRAVRATGRLSADVAAGQVAAAFGDGGDLAEVPVLLGQLDAAAVVAAARSGAIPWHLFDVDPGVADQIRRRVGVACAHQMAATADQAGQHELHDLIRGAAGMEAALGHLSANTAYGIAASVLADLLETTGAQPFLRAVEGRLVEALEAGEVDCATSRRLLALAAPGRALERSGPVLHALIDGALDGRVPLAAADVVAAIAHPSAHLLADVLEGRDGPIDADTVSLFAQTGPAAPVRGHRLAGRLTPDAVAVAADVFPAAAYFAGRHDLLEQVLADTQAGQIVRRLPVDGMDGRQLALVLAAAESDVAAQQVLDRCDPAAVTTEVVATLLDRFQSRHRTCDWLAEHATELSDDAVLVALRSEHTSRVRLALARRPWACPQALTGALGHLRAHHLPDLLLEPGPLPVEEVVAFVCRHEPDRAAEAVGHGLREAGRLPAFAAVVAAGVPAAAFVRQAPEALGAVLAGRLGDDTAAWRTALELLDGWAGTLGELADAAATLPQAG